MEGNVGIADVSNYLKKGDWTEWGIIYRTISNVNVSEDDDVQILNYMREKKGSHMKSDSRTAVDIKSK